MEKYKTVEEVINRYQTLYQNFNEERQQLLKSLAELSHYKVGDIFVVRDNSTRYGGIRVKVEDIEVHIRTFDNCPEIFYTVVFLNDSGIQPLADTLYSISESDATDP